MLEPPDSDDEETEAEEIQMPADYTSSVATLKEASKKPGKFFLWHSELKDSRWLKYTCQDVGPNCKEFKLGCLEGVEFVYPVDSTKTASQLREFSQTAAS